MAITLRGTKGSKLTHAELDANFTSFQDSPGSSEVGFIQSGAGAVARTVQDKERDIVNLLDFNVNANGTGDDAAGIQAAIDSLPSSGGTIILGKQGSSFRFASTININKKIWFKGHGFNENTGVPTPTKFIKASTLNGTGFNVTGARSILEGFVLDAEGGNGGDGIVFDENGISAKYMSIYNQGRDGLRIGKDAGGNSNSWFLESCSSKVNGRHGFYIHSGASNANAGVGIRVESNLNAGDGFLFGTAVANTIVGILAEANTLSGLHLATGSSKNVFLGGDLDEANVLRDLTIDAGSSNNTIWFTSVTSARTSDSGTANNIATVDAGTNVQGLSASILRTRAGVTTTVANGNNNNLAIPAASFSRVTGASGAWALTGMVAGSDGQRFVLLNNTGQTGTINHDDANSSAANRIYASAGGNVTLPNLGTVEFIYSTVNARWLVLRV